MIVNRSVPRSAVIPVLTYDDVDEASEWLCRAFGFKERLLAGRTERRVATNPVTHAVHVRVEDADRLPIRERQYSAVDVAGHHWTFSQSIADVDPAS